MSWNSPFFSEKPQSKERGEHQTVTVQILWSLRAEPHVVIQRHAQHGRVLKGGVVDPADSNLPKVTTLEPAEPSIGQISRERDGPLSLNQSKRTYICKTKLGLLQSPPDNPDLIRPALTNPSA
ncbi:hypothetical protein ON010_g12598 [Phytophthora cinnamomi]|nr:hypothetical protein ON010_g12598 [Phytophthora cinnamomi]